MKKKTTAVSLTALSLAIVLVTTGLAGITHFNSAGAEFLRNVNTAFGGKNDFIPVIMSIIELAAGILMLLHMFTLVPGRIFSPVVLVVFIYWVIRIILNFFVEGFAEPDFLIWLGDIAPHLVILAALWSVYRGRMI